MPRRVTFEWATRRDGNNGWVLETCGPRWRREFGPMPAHAVPQFVMSRRRLIAMYMQRLGADYVLEDPQQFFIDANKETHRVTTPQDPGRTSRH